MIKPRLTSALFHFFASRFSVQERVLWRVLGLLKPHKRSVVIANVLLAVASLLAGVGLVSLLPLVNLTITNTTAAAPPKASHVAAPAESARPDAAGSAPAAAPKARHKASAASSGATSWSRDLAANNHLARLAFQRFPFLEAGLNGAQRKWLRIEAWTSASTVRFVFVYSGFLLVLVTLRGVFQFLGEYKMERTAILAMTDLMRRLYRNILSQDMLFFNNTTTGALLNICYRQVFELEGLVTLLASTRIILPIQMLVLFGALLFVSLQLSLMLLVLLPIVIIPTMLLTRRLKRGLSGELRQETGMLDVMTEGLQGIHAIKAFGAEALEMDYLEPGMDDWLRYTCKRRAAQALLGPVVDALNMAVVLSVFLAAAFFLPRSLFQPDRLVVFMVIVTRFYKPFRSVMSMGIRMQRATQVGRRVFQLLDRQPEIVDAPNAVDFPESWRTLRLENVGLSYRTGRKGRVRLRRALQGVNIEIHRGEAVVLVGPNGAGKSSLVNLVCRLYEPTEGTIRFGDVPLSQIRMQSIREHICLITQHPVLFNRAVNENIAFGLENIAPGEIAEAAKATRADVFVRALPQGYDTPIGEQGRLLSGGERQKLVLARAFVRHPDILILDEPTAGLDHETKEEFLDLVSQLRGTGLTIIYITHEFAQLARFERVLRLTDEQTIVEENIKQFV